jgi:bilirubin oxidase
MSGQTVNLMSYSSQLPNNIIGSNQVSAGPATLPGYAANPLNGADFNLLQLVIGVQTPNPVLSIPSAFQPVPALSTALADTTRQITFSPEMMSPQNMISGPFLLNGSAFDMDSVNIVIPLNNTEIWSLVNNTMVAHPFHIHDVEFQILDRNGVAVAPVEAGWKDVVLVKPMETVRFITKFEDFSNDSVPYMYHCHLLHHEDEGMMGAFIVTNGLTSGLSYAEKNASLLFPNPVIEQLTLVAPDAAQPVVVDLTGRPRPVNVSKSENGWIIQTDQLESGVYILRYYTGEDINLIKFVRL